MHNLKIMLLKNIYLQYQSATINGRMILARCIDSFLVCSGIFKRADIKANNGNKVKDQKSKDKSAETTILERLKLVRYFIIFII